MVDSIQNCIVTGFETYEPDPTFDFATRGTVPHSEWKTITPVKAPPVDQTLPQLIQTMVKSAWKWTEPSSKNRSNMKFVMGSRPPGPGASINPVYNPVVRPAKEELVVAMGNDSKIATDWNLFNGIERVNAITFRGDSRPPSEVITNAVGFHPPHTRTDDHYLAGAIYNAFNDYYVRRYDRRINKTEFLKTVNEAAQSPQKTKMFIDYMTWRGLMRREASHLGRMASHECLKGYISTSRSIDSSIGFGFRANGSTDGYYIYVTQVNSGFVVPDDATPDVQWGTGEAEIAQLGPIPAERILGFRKFVRTDAVGPVHMRTSFRSTEPKAFEKAFKILSGAKPNRLEFI